MQRTVPNHPSRSASNLSVVLAFSGIAVAVYAAVAVIREFLPRVERPEVLAWALTLDLVVMVPLAWVLLLVRRRRWPAISTLPVFLLSLAGVALMLPRAGRGPLHTIGLLAAPAELLLLGFVAVRAWRGVARYRALHGGAADPGAVLEHLRQAAREVLGVPVAADVLAYELAVLHFALLSWRRRPAAGKADGGDAFAYHRAGAYPAVLVGLLFAVVAELLALHLLISTLWSPVAAWALTALSAYSALWLLGDYRAMVLRPLRLDGRGLEVRIGLRWHLHVPLDAIAAVHPVAATEPWPRDRRSLRATVLAPPRLRIELARPLTALGPYGIRKQVERIGLAVDDGERFARQLDQLLPTAAQPDAP